MCAIRIQSTTRGTIPQYARQPRLLFARSRSAFPIGDNSIMSKDSRVFCAINRIHWTGSMVGRNPMFAWTAARAAVHDYFVRDRNCGSLVSLLSTTNLCRNAGRYALNDSDVAQIFQGVVLYTTLEFHNLIGFLVPAFMQALCP